MAVNSLTAELWPQQLPALVIHTVHRSVKARRYRYSYPNLNVQLLQSAITWIPLEMESPAVRSLEVQLLAVHRHRHIGYCGSAAASLSWLVINPNNRQNENVKELQRIILEPSQMNLKWSTEPIFSKWRKFSGGHHLFWDGFCKALSSVVVQSSSQDCDSGIPFFVVVIYLF